MLTPSQNAELDRADRELAELRHRTDAAAARERVLDQRRTQVAVLVEYPQSGRVARRSGGRLSAEDIKRDVDALTAVRAACPRPAPVPDFVLEVFKHVAAWERAPLFVHAQFIRDLRRLSSSMEDARAVQMSATDAMANAIATIAGMHSTWAALHTAARRLVTRLENGFGDDEDDIGSLQRLQRKLFSISAMLVTAHVIESRGLKLNVAAVVVTEPKPAPKPVSPAHRHREALRAAIARGDVVWSGDRP